MRHRLFIALSLIIIGFALVWYFQLSQPWRQRIPPGWTWESDFIGVLTLPDPISGQFPRHDTTGQYRRVINWSSDDPDSSGVTLEDHYIVRDTQTQQVAYEYISRALVNPQTGEHLDARYRGEYVVFPQNTQRQTYVLRSSYLKGIPVDFQHVEEIETLSVYKFVYKGRMEYTELYAGTDDYPGLKVTPGQEIRCADDQFVFQVWVEPVTGEVLKLDESCYSGDYIYDIATNTQVAAMYRWGGITEGDDLLERADQIRGQRQRYLLATRYLPLVLLAGGIGLLIPGLVRLRTSLRLGA